jgi:hypothetical protein
MDTDMVVLGDLAELWKTSLEPTAVCAARRQTLDFPRFCVMLWDCARAKAVLPDVETLRADPGSHARLREAFGRHPAWVQAMDPAFNAIDGEHLPPERIKVLHYSDMGTQFSHPHALPRLAREGRTHWFDGEILPHPRADLTAIFEAELAEALAAGRRLDDYRNPSPYGLFAKKSERTHQGNPVTRGRRRFRLFSRFWAPAGAPGVARTPHLKR